jgi:hypothetical protein
MAWATTALIVSTAISAYGAIRQARASKKAGEAQQDAAESQAGLADYNAAVAEVQAKDAITRGAEDEHRFRSSIRTLIGSQRAAFAASNVDVSFGSAVDVQADAAELGELDALTIRNNAAREAWGYNVQADDLRKRAEIARKEGVYFEQQGRAAATGAYIGAAGTILGSTTSYMAQRYGFNNSGGGGGIPTLQSRTYAGRGAGYN